MAKSPGKRRPHHRESDMHRDRDRENEQMRREPREVEPKEEQQSPAETATATAVEAPPAPKAAVPERPVGASTDISAIDEETNARYEQVKGGKLYIRDLQQMD